MRVGDHRRRAREVGVRGRRRGVGPPLQKSRFETPVFGERRARSSIAAASRSSLSMRVPDLFQSGVQGLNRQIDKLNAAANEVLVQSTEPSTPDRVDVSAAAKEAAASGTSSTSGIEGAMVDMRVSKYLAVAN